MIHAEFFPDREERWILLVGEQHLRPLHPARPLGARARNVRQSSNILTAHRQCAHERVHDATTLQTCTAEYRYDLLGHHRLLVPDVSRFGAPGRAAPARRFSLTPNPANLCSKAYPGAAAVPREGSIVKVDQEEAEKQIKDRTTCSST
jgi:hypothetical protein